MTREQLLEQAKHLIPAERIGLVGDIWDTLEAEELAWELTPAQAAELERRLAAHRADPSSAIPWSEYRSRRTNAHG